MKKKEPKNSALILVCWVSVKRRNLNRTQRIWINQSAEMLVTLQNFGHTYFADIFYRWKHITRIFTSQRQHSTRNIGAERAGKTGTLWTQCNHLRWHQNAWIWCSSWRSGKLAWWLVWRQIRHPILEEDDEWSIKPPACRSWHFSLKIFWKFKPSFENSGEKGLLNFLYPLYRLTNS